MDFSDKIFRFDGEKFFLKDTRTGSPSEKTSFRAEESDGDFRFRFECKENYFCPKHFNYNDPLYDGDIVELMITLGDKRRYLEIECNYNNADYCVIIDNRDGEGDIIITPLEENVIKSRVETLADGWACDIILSVKELKKLGFGNPFYFNAHRQDYDETGYLNLYSLSPTFCDKFHKTTAFLRAEIKEDI